MVHPLTHVPKLNSEMHAASERHSHYAAVHYVIVSDSIYVVSSVAKHCRNSVQRKCNPICSTLSCARSGGILKKISS